MAPLDWLTFATTLLALALVSYQSVSKKSSYLVANRSVGLFALTATLVMTEFNTATLLAFSGVGYRAGPMALSLSFVFLVGLGWYTVSVARHWKRFDRTSVAELFADRYGQGMGRTASLLLIVAMIGFSATYVKSLTLIFLPVTSSLTPWWLSAVLCGLVLALTVSGGLLSVIRADVFSFVVTLLLLPGLLGIAVYRHGGPKVLARVFDSSQLTVSPLTQWSHPQLPFWFVTSLIVLTCFTYICSPWYGQKIFAAKDERTAFISVGLASVLVFLLYGCTQLAASYYRLDNPNLALAETVVPQMISAWFPPVLKGLGFAVLFAAALTTLSGVWSAMVAMVASDFSLRALDSVGRQRWLTAGFALASWLAANLLVDDILNRLILANIPIAALSFALLAGFYWPKASRVGAWASAVVGVFWGVGCFVHFGDGGGYTWYWSIFGIPLIFATGIVGSWCFPNVTRRYRDAHGRSPGNGASR